MEASFRLLNCALNLTSTRSDNVLLSLSRFAVFFDDEYRNSEVGTKLGVHFVEIGHQGLDYGTFEKGIREWRAKMKAREGKDASKSSGEESD